MPVLSDLIHQIQIAIDTFWYQILMTLAAFQWSLLRGALMMGYTIQLLTNWLTNQAFAPLIQQTGASLQVATTWAFVLALFVLGFTYMLASIVRLDVVSPRNAILWYIAGVLFFQFGPALYRGMDDFRRSVSAAFYLSVLNAVQGQAGSALTSLNGVQTAELGILTPCDNFGPYLGRSGGGGAAIIIGGLDMALAYLRADGIDVMGYPYPTSDNCQPHVPPQSFPIPWEWYRPGSFFDNTQSPPFFPDLTDEQRGQSMSLAGAAQRRLFSSWPLVLFGIFEQIVGLCLAIAQGLTFISFACAILFAFFKRTESVAWSIVDQWLELIVQAVVIALIQALVVSFFLAAAATNNGLVVIGVGLLCLVFMAMLLRSGLKAIWRSFNRLFDAFGKATGGTVITVGAAAQTTVSAGVAVAAGGLSLVGNTLGSASALANGASWAQAAGIAFGGSQMLSGAARTLSRLPGLQETELTEAADHFVEGAMTRRVARGVPVVGRVSGPVAGALLLTDRNQDHAVEDDEGRLSQPMLVPAMGRNLAAFTRGPVWKRKVEAAESEEEPLEGAFTPLRPPRLGRFTPVTPVPSDEPQPVPGDSPEVIAEMEAVSQRSDFREQETGEEIEQQMTDVVYAAEEDEIATGGMSAAGLETAARRLEQAAESLEQAARQQMHRVEGRLDLGGGANVASVMGDVIELTQAERAMQGKGILTGLDNFGVANKMAEAMGVTPLANGNPPIENDLARFGVFANQALSLGLNGEQTERVVREVKESPEARLLPETRAALVEQVHTGRGLAWDSANLEVDRLEHSARILPDNITAYGGMNIPVNPPPVAQVEVHPDLRITVEAGSQTPLVSEKGRAE
jgi:hypothetical protein